MNSGVRIVKHGRDDGLQSLSPGQAEKTAKQSEREIVSTVKAWIAESEQRRQADRRSAFARIK
jgi:hypothetical protein